MVDRESNGILKRLVSQWDHLKAEIERLQSAAEVRPGDGYQVFQPVDSEAEGVAAFEIQPSVFNLPERANDVSMDLFVVVEGRISFRRREFAEENVLATHSFATKVAYFRHRSTSLVHVYGAHYDFSLDELGHPVFHAEMRGYPELAEYVKECYGVGNAVDDRVTGLLKNVRVPTAQMDVFSVFVQLCADHLLYTDSGPEEKAAFNSLLQRSAFCKGAAYQMPHLQTEEARTCYRSRHWYTAIA